LPSLLDLVHTESGKIEPDKAPGMRVSGGTFGPDRVLSERIARYGVGRIVVGSDVAVVEPPAAEAGTSLSSQP
jgi:hypothetical protein